VVKAIQTKNGSRSAYARVEKAGAWPTEITPDAAQFIEAQTSVFFATANSGGQPYIQRRGGPAGFLKVLNETTIGFADFSGNRQYISIGNFAENPRACLFLIDYVHRRRIKLWGKAEVVEDDADLLTRLMPQDYTARPERAILFRLAAFDSNCPQHIPQRFEAADVAAALQQRDLRIAALEGELAALGRSAA
jgi:uncharacterized protein